MSYSSSLTDAEWKILEPLLPQILPSEKADTTLQLDKARDPQWHPSGGDKRPRTITGKAFDAIDPLAKISAY